MFFLQKVVHIDSERSFTYTQNMDTPTKREEQRIHALRKFYSRKKRLPSYSEMLGLFEVKSKNAVYKFIEKLVEKDLVKKDASGKLVPGERLFGVKILGAVEAGFPSPAEEELADVITLDDYLIENKQATYLLRVSGRSMINAGINPDDLVLVDRTRSASIGDIVIAKVDDEYTIKRFDKKNGKVVLMPENDAFEPIYPQDSLSIEGVVIGVIRKYH